MSISIYQCAILLFIFWICLVCFILCFFLENPSEATETEGKCEWFLHSLQIKDASSKYWWTFYFVLAPDDSRPDSQSELRVVVQPDVIQVQRGQTVELRCVVYGADSSTSVYWVQEEPERVIIYNLFLKLKASFVFLSAMLKSIMSQRMTRKSLHHRSH